IESTGYEVMLCSLCLEEGVRCKMVDGVKSCSQCTKRGCSCDAGWVSMSSQRLLERQRELADAQARLSESLGRLFRLKKQQRFLQEKGIKLVNEGL
ncbi:hypothetical protein M406DRAFT_224691, partial [Cryphonectria parasitica EP155]